MNNSSKNKKIISTTAYEESMRRYECIKKISLELKKSFKNIQANTYGFCCRTDYDAKAKPNKINYNDYVVPQIYKGGLNNNYQKDYASGKYFFNTVNADFPHYNINYTIYYLWNCTEYPLEKILKVMRSVAKNYNACIIKPKNHQECIKLTFKTKISL